jgi:hypothetical protein
MKYSILGLSFALALPSVGCGGDVYRLASGSSTKAPAAKADASSVWDSSPPAQDTQPPSPGSGATADADVEGGVEPDANGTDDAQEVGIATDIGIDAGTDIGIDAGVDEQNTGSSLDAAIGTMPAGPFCTLAAHRFCDDFDQVPLPGPWSAVNKTGGTLAPDPTAFVSQPNSLLVQFLPLLPPKVLDTGLTKIFSMPLTPATIVWGLQFQPASVDPTPNSGAVIGALDSFDGLGNRYGTQFTLYPQIDGLHLWFEEDSGFADGTFHLVRHDLGHVLSLGTWSEIRLELAFAGIRTASARVFVGGVAQLESALTVTVTGKVLQLTIGSSFETLPSRGWDLRYDNVTLDF